MSNVSASTEPITVADLDAAKQVATDCLNCVSSAVITFHATDYPPPGALPGTLPPEAHQVIAMLLEELNAVIDRAPLVAKVERFFTELDGVGLPGVGLETNGHRLALRFAMIVRGKINNGVALAAREQMRVSGGELCAAIKQIWESSPETQNLKIADLPVPKKLMARTKADRLRYQPYMKPAPGQRVGPPQTADEIAAVLVPQTWQAIQKLMSDLLEIDSVFLRNRINTEYLTACRFAAAQPPPPRLTFDVKGCSITLDGITYTGLAHEFVVIIQAIFQASPRRIKSPSLLAATGLSAETRVDRILKSKKVPEVLRGLIDSDNSGYRIVLPVRSPSVP